MTYDRIFPHPSAQVQHTVEVKLAIIQLEELGVLIPALAREDYSMLVDVLKRKLAYGKSGKRGPKKINQEYWDRVGREWFKLKTRLDSNALGAWLEANRGTRTKSAFQRGLARWQQTSLLPI